MPPPAPRVCFGRDKLTEKVVGIAENLEPAPSSAQAGLGKCQLRSPSPTTVASRNGSAMKIQGGPNNVMYLRSGRRSGTRRAFEDTTSSRPECPSASPVSFSPPSLSFSSFFSFLHSHCSGASPTIGSAVGPVFASGLDTERSNTPSGLSTRGTLWIMKSHHLITCSSVWDTINLSQEIATVPRSLRRRANKHLWYV